MSLNEFSLKITPRTRWGLAADFLWLPAIMYLWHPEQLIATGTLDKPWSRQQMGCEHIYLCLIGRGWVFSWWHLWLAILISAATCFIVRSAFVALNQALDRTPLPPPDMREIIQTLPLPRYF